MTDKQLTASEFHSGFFSELSEIVHDSVPRCVTWKGQPALLVLRHPNRPYELSEKVSEVVARMREDRVKEDRRRT